MSISIHNILISIYISIFKISIQNHCSQDFDPSKSWHWLGIPHPANGAKKARKKLIFLEQGPHASVRHTAFSKHDGILQRIQPWPPNIPIPI